MKLDEGWSIDIVLMPIIGIVVFEISGFKMLAVIEQIRDGHFVGSQSACFICA